MSVDPRDLGGRFDCVFDVGAHIGDFANSCLRAWPGCTVDSFEPLRKLANLQPGGPWRWHQVALGELPADRTMFRCEFEPSSSLLQMADLHREAFPYTTASEAVTVPVRRLYEYADLIHGRALLKLDVQGYELHVLRGAGETLGRFDAVVLEVSHVELYHGAPTPMELWRFLCASGFRHDRRVDEMPHPETHEVLQSDELWVRA